jgi:hypothetical protein
MVASTTTEQTGLQLDRCHRRGPIERCLCRIAEVCLKSSLANFKTRCRCDDFMDWYAILFALLLTGLIVIAPMVDQFWPWIVAGVASYRIFDISIYRIHFLLVRSRRSPWAIGRVRRSFSFAVVNFYETAVAFAIIFCAFPLVGSTSPERLSRLTSVYFSFVTMLTVGYGDLTPRCQSGHLVVLAQLISTMIFAAFILPMISGNMATAMTRHSESG